MLDQYVTVDEKCAAFLFFVNAILEAGLWAEPKGILLFDVDGNLWKKQPEEMNADDAVEYMGHQFGPLFATFVKQTSGSRTAHTALTPTAAELGK